MAHGITRREFTAAAAGVATLAPLGLDKKAKAAGTKTLRFIPQTDVQVLDPIWTTAYVTRNHGYMVFDTLFAIDSKFKPHPQMVEGFGYHPTTSTTVSCCATGSNSMTGSRCAAPIARPRSSAGWRATRSARQWPQSLTT